MTLWKFAVYIFGFVGKPLVFYGQSLRVCARLNFAALLYIASGYSILIKLFTLYYLFHIVLYHIELYFYYVNGFTCVYQCACVSLCVLCVVNRLEWNVEICTCHSSRFFKTAETRSTGYTTRWMYICVIPVNCLCERTTNMGRIWLHWVELSLAHSAIKLYQWLGRRSLASGLAPNLLLVTTLWVNCWLWVQLSLLSIRIGKWAVINCNCMDCV